MSVIYGKVNFNNQPLYKHDLIAVETVLNHWHADVQDLWVNNKHVGLGHLMLYNTPESLNEKLPYYNSGHEVAITADARIDNREELLAKLGLTSTSAQPITDSQLILQAYLKYKEGCVKYLLGDFAFAIWDEREQKLFCGRDHLGIKPFFYYLDSHFFAFASEKKGLLELPGLNKAINKQFLYNQLFFASNQAVDTTLYEHIMRIPPASILTLDARRGSIKLSKYWEPDVETELKFGNRQDYYDGLLAHFTEAVKCRVRSNFDVGAQLSGGMDSSSITGVASKLMRAEGRELITLANTLPDGVEDTELIKLDERKYIDAVNDFNHIKNRVYIVERAFESQLEEIDFSLRVNDGMERWNPLWLLPLKKAALQNNIRTLLSGFPGDELITYRGKYYFMDYFDKREYLKYFLATKKFPGFSKVEPFLPGWFKQGYHNFKGKLKIYDDRVKSTLQMFNIPDEYIRNRTAHIWNDPNFKEKFKSYRHLQRYRILNEHTSHRMESEMRYGLYFRTEPRFPMADIRLVQYYLSMPNELKYEGTLARTAFRKALKDYLPSLILERDSKYGSIAPFLALSKSESPFKEIFKTLPDNNILNKEVVQKRLEKHELNKQKKTAQKPNRIDMLPSLEVLRWIEKNPDLINTLS